MLHHLSLGVTDLARAIAFYDGVLAALGQQRLWRDARGAGYGAAGESDRLALKQVQGRPGDHPGCHVAFAASQPRAVQAFHAAALSLGGSDDGAPGLRPQYGAHYYAAFVRDPDGHRLEAVVTPRATLAHVAYLVRDYDEALAWFTGVLGFRLLEDTPRGPGKRWLTVQPPGGGTSLLLARAATPQQVAQVGVQAGGRVFLFLSVDDFAREHARLQANGVRFLEAPRREDYGWVAVFADLYGQRWDLLGPH